MMVVCQSHSCKLRVFHEDGTVKVLHFASRAEKNEAKAFYTQHGFKVK
jgi:hypothetical protein